MLEPCVDRGCQTPRPQSLAPLGKLRICREGLKAELRASLVCRASSSSTTTVSWQLSTWVWVLPTNFLRTVSQLVLSLSSHQDFPYETGIWSCSVRKMKTIWKSLDSYLETAAGAAVHGFEPVLLALGLKRPTADSLNPHCGL